MKKIIKGILTSMIVIALFGCQTQNPEEIAYNEAKTLLENGEYDSAIKEFEKLGDYEDSEEMVLESYYQYGVYLFEEKRFQESVQAFEKCPDYKDSNEQRDRTMLVYVKLHKNNMDNLSRRYLDDLCERGNEEALQLRGDWQQLTVTEWKSYGGYDADGNKVSNYWFFLDAPYTYTVNGMTYEFTYPDGVQFSGTVNGAKTGEPFDLTYDVFQGPSKIEHSADKGTHCVFWDKDGNVIGDFYLGD